MDTATIDRAQAVVDAARARLATWNGPCSACRHSRRSLRGRICRNPVVKLAAEIHHYEEERRFIMQCSEQRKPESPWGEAVCGPDGALFAGDRAAEARNFVASMTDAELRRLADMDETARLAHRAGLRFAEMERIVMDEQAKRA